MKFRTYEDSLERPMQRKMDTRNLEHGMLGVCRG